MIYGSGADPLVVLGNALPVISKREVEGEATTYIGSLFPTGFIQTFPNHVTFGLMTPDGWNRTRIVLYFYYPGESATDPALAEERARMEKEWDLVFTQDDPFVRNVHDNLKVRDQAGIRHRFLALLGRGGAPFSEDGGRDHPAGRGAGRLGPATGLSTR